MHPKLYWTMGIVLLVIEVLIIALSFFVGIKKYFADQPPQFDPQTYIAVVNNQGITRDDFNKQVAELKQFYTFSKQDLSQLPPFENTVLDNMIDDVLTAQYAAKNWIMVNARDLGRVYRAQAGKTQESENLLLSKIKNMYGMDRDDYLDKLSRDIIRDKVQARVGEPIVRWLENEKARAQIQRL